MVVIWPEAVVVCARVVTEEVSALELVIHSHNVVAY